MQPRCGRSVLQSTFCRSASAQQGRTRACTITRRRTCAHLPTATITPQSAHSREPDGCRKSLSVFEIKTVIAGHSGKPGVVTEAKILNRVLRAVPTGWEYECDQRHADIILEELDLKDCTPVGTPGVEETLKRSAEDEALGAIPLSPAMATQYWGLTPRANYMAQDRAEIHDSVEELCRIMSAPSNDSWSKLKRLAKYLAGRPRAVSLFSWQSATDANWAGCKTSRKSTSGGTVLWGSSVLKSYSKTQGTIAQSSAKSELIAVVKAACEAIGTVSLAVDLGIKSDKE